MNVVHGDGYGYFRDDRLNAFNEEAAVDLFFEAMPGSSGRGLWDR